MEQCCTSAADVDYGTARDVDRCGLSFAKLSSDFYGTQCWQRDQPGVVDDSCPGVQVDLRSADPGCCSDRGYCGGVDSDHGLGCHSDPSAPQQRCGGAVVVDGGTGGDDCDVTGLYALMVDVDVVWGGRSGGLWDVTEDGRGLQRMALLAQIDQVDSRTLALRGTVRTCAVEAPAFYSTLLCEAYHPIFSDKIWESGAMPTFEISGRLQCERPGCILSIDAQTVLLGISLDNPEAPWPSADADELTCAAGEGEQCFPDQDGDGRPGLSVELAKTGSLPSKGDDCRDGYARRGAPLSASPAAIFDGVRRTDRMQLGSRVKVGGSFTLGDACAHAEGLGIVEYVNTRAWGCLVQEGTANEPFGRKAGPDEPCSTDEMAFLDENMPLYRVLAVGEEPSDLMLNDDSASQGPRVRLIRLGALDSGASCSEVRAAMAHQ